MKKSIIVLLLFSIFISSCALLSGAEPVATPLSPTPLPTATPDPCAPDNMKEELQPLVDLINVYRDTAFVASVTDKMMMTVPLLELQENRRAIQNLEVPQCQDQLKAAALEYTIASINVFSA